MSLPTQKPATTPIPVQLSENDFTAFILPHLSMPKRGPKCKLGYHRLFNLELVASFANRPNLLKYGEQTCVCAGGTSLERAGNTSRDHAHAVPRAAAAFYTFFWQHCFRLPRMVFTLATAQSVTTPENSQPVHSEVSSHAGIIVCTRDDDVEALADRIHHELQRAPTLHDQLLRINRPSV